MRAYPDDQVRPDWTVQPVGRRFSVVLGKMLDSGRAARADDIVLPYLRAANVQDFGLALESVNEMPFTAAERLTLDLRADDLLLVEGGAVGTGHVLDRDLPGWSFQKTLNRVRANTVSGRTRYLAYVLRDLRDRGVVEVLCNKSTIPHLTAEKVLALRVPVPPSFEQDRIVNYLDRETARIDELIAEQETLLESLDARRVSSAERLFGARIGRGQRLKFTFREVDERAGASRVQAPLLSVTVSRGVVPRSELTDDLPRAEDLSNYKVVTPGDLVIIRMRAFQGALGLAYVTGLVSPDYAVLRFSLNVDGEWAASVMRSAAFVGEMILRLRGIGGRDSGAVRTPRVSVGDIGEIRVDVPQLAEQSTELAMIRRSEESIAGLAAEVQGLISVLRERRAALITGAVTGKIDVRGHEDG